MFVIYNDKILTSGEGICSFPTDCIPKQVDQRSVYHALAVLRCNTQQLLLTPAIDVVLLLIFIADVPDILCQFEVSVQFQFYNINESKLKNAYQNSWTLNISVGCWALASEPWILGSSK